MSSTYVELPAPVLLDVTEYLRRERQQREAAAILEQDEPLTDAQRQTLEHHLEWWQVQYETARHQVRAITARLAHDQT